MSNRYQVLARRYRPQAFRDVVGQEAAVTTLKNAIRLEKIAHAYLFCGSRGVGKTTLARLFAKALNCGNLTQDLEPCGNCPSCKEIAHGQSLDVIEIDGASNRGIDDIRQINETVGYAPSHGKYKIYIIDEVHMLTKEAFNALLKTLEEPPESVKFFFATTEPHKVLPTIISRTQRFDLARIKTELIIQKLSQIAQDLERSVEPQALELIADFSEGSLRDAESLFDQILCFSEKTVSASDVRQTLGLAPKEIFNTLDLAFSSGHLPAAFEIVDDLFRSGKDLVHFFEQLIQHYRNLANAKCKNLKSPAAAYYNQHQALHILDLLIQAEGSFQKSAFQRTALESILLKIIRSKNRIPVEILVRNLIENAHKIEERPIQEAPPIREEAQAPVQKIAPQPKPVPPIKEMPIQDAPPPKPEPVQETPKAAPPPKLAPKEDKPALKPAPFRPLPTETDVAQKHPSHYDTVIRFAAVEFEGIVKN